MGQTPPVSMTRGEQSRGPIPGDKLKEPIDFSTVSTEDFLRRSSRIRTGQRGRGARVPQPQPPCFRGCLSVVIPAVFGVRGSVRESSADGPDEESWITDHF